MKCRHCQTKISQRFLDLGTAPPSNNYVQPDQLESEQVSLPLRVLVCPSCWLVQTEDFVASDELFTESYAYFSSTSKSWLAHAKQYCDEITERLSLGPKSFVVELASNDGYLLKNFVAAGVPCLGVEPTHSTAQAARAIGVPTEEVFFGADFGRELSKRGQKADLILGNNVYAHVPDINDFTEGMSIALKESGTITLEFPHLLNMIRLGQFDTVYHEHYSYLSLLTVEKIFKKFGLVIYDVQELPTHGGSLRIFGGHEAANWTESPAVAKMREREVSFGLNSLQVYNDFQSGAEVTRDGLLDFLRKLKEDGKSVAGYGAAAKGNTLLNFAGVDKELLPFVCDAAPSKQGTRLPGSMIPVCPPAKLTEERPDYVLVLPWNLIDEIKDQFKDLRALGTKFVTAVPEIEFHE